MSPSRDDQLSPPERDALAGEYVLGLLDEAEFAAAERRLDTDRDFAASVERWRLHFFALDATATPIAPRVDLWPRIEAGRLRPERSDGVATTSATSSRSSVLERRFCASSNPYEIESGRAATCCGSGTELFGGATPRRIAISVRRPAPSYEAR